MTFSFCRTFLTLLYHAEAPGYGVTMGFDHTVGIHSTQGWVTITPIGAIITLQAMLIVITIHTIK